MNAIDLIQATLATPKTHVVVTTYADGTVKRQEAHSATAANTHADFVERPKIGRDLISRDTGKTVRVVSVEIVALA